MPCLLAAVGLCLTLAAGNAAAAEYRWVGKAATGGLWSSPENWAGREAPAAASKISTLTFPELESARCGTREPVDACYLSENNVSGLNVDKMELDDGDHYLILGEEFTLGGGGLVASPGKATAGRGGALLAIPLVLGERQTWSISQRSGGSDGEDEVWLFGNVSGNVFRSPPLAVEVSDGPFLRLADDVEVGKLEVRGTSLAGKRLANGDIFLEGAELNAEDGQAVELSHIVIQGSGATGPLQTDDAAVNVGNGFAPAEGMEAASVRLDEASQINFAINSSGGNPQEDYSQLVSQGEVQLANAELNVAVHPPKPGAPCPTFAQGQTFTFISTTGPLSGTFSDAPENGSELEIGSGEGCPKTSQTMRIAYQRSGSTKTVTGTVEAKAKEQREGQEAKEKQELKELRERLEARERQEKEAKGGVLSVKESAPDATIAGTSVTVNSAGAFKLKIACPGGEASCAGTVTLRTSHAVSAARKRKPSVLTLATGSFDIAGGATKAIVLHLTTAARRLLARLHTLGARVTIVAHNPTGATHSGQTFLTLRTPKAKRHND